MKKLMTMIAAVAVAFGLYATDTLNNSVDFSGYTAVNPWLLTGQDGQTRDTLWAWTGAAALPAENEAKIESGALVLGTGSNVLSRNFAAAATAIDDGLFVDMVLDFDVGNGVEALDAVPTVEDGKIAIFALDQTEIEGAPAETNIYVLANYGTEGKALYNLGVFDFTTPRRVALKAYENVITGAADARAGFLVYMGPANAQVTTLTPAKAIAVYAFDENDEVVWTDVKGEAPNYLGRSDVMASKWVNGKQLFISLDTKPTTAAKLASVDFVGRAKLASITLTDESTDWPADDVRMPVTLTDAKLTDITNATLDNGYLVANDNGDMVTFKAGSDTKANVTVEYNGEISGPDEDGVYTIVFNEANILTVTGWNTAATVNGKAYPTIDAAITAAIDAATKSSDPVMFKLNADIESGAALNFSPTADLAGSIVLDLMGKKITNNAALATVVTVGEKAVLTITDSEGDGEIVATGNYGATVSNSGDLTIEKGIFTGEVVINDGAETTITGGAFDNGHNQKTTIENYVDDGYEVVAGEGELAGYWVVQEIQKTDIKDALVTASATYGDAAPAVTVTLNETTIDPANYDATSAYTSTTAAGTVITVTVTAKGDIYTGSASGDFTVAKKALTVSVSLDVTEATFDAAKTAPGDYATPTITGLDGVDAGEYTAAWNPTEVTAEGGEFTYTVTAKQDGNYTFEPASATLTIKKAGPVYPDDWPKTDDATKAKYITWATGKTLSGDKDIDQKAFLLNCDPNAKAVADEEEAFTITKIEQVEGEWVITVKDKNLAGKDFNVAATVKAFSAPTCAVAEEVKNPAGTETELFWKAFLDFPAAD